MRRFTKKEDQFLRDNYLTTPACRISKILGKSKVAASQRMKLLGLIVPSKIIDQFKEDSRIKKGNCPANKGKRQIEFMSSAGIENTKATRFSQGHLPHNTKSDLCITTRTDNRGIKYKFIRISLSKWMPLHRYNWEHKNEPIAKGLKLIFKDGNTMNCDISNLELLTSRELMKRNSLHNYPKPIAQAIQLRGALNRQIRKHIKNIKHEK